MPSDYRHLTNCDCCRARALGESGLSQRTIAAETGHYRLSVSGELACNTGLRDYRHGQARRLAKACRQNASLLPLQDVDGTLGDGREVSAARLDPGQAFGRPAPDGLARVNLTWIYRHVWADRTTGSCLFRHFRCGRKRHRRGRDGVGQGVIPGRVDISKYTGIKEWKRCADDREVDTIIGAGLDGAPGARVDHATQLMFPNGLIGGRPPEWVPR